MTYSIYSDSYGHPDKVLTQFTLTLAPSDILNGEITTGVFSSNSPSVPLTLHKNTAYWFAVQGPGEVVWETGGTASVPSAHINTGTRTVYMDGTNKMEFAVYGSPAGVPEPGTNLLAGVALSCLAGAKFARSRLRSRPGR